MVAKKIEFIKGIFKSDEKTFQSLHSKGYGVKNGDFFEYDMFEILFLLEKGKVFVENNRGEILDFEKIILLKKVDLNNYHVYRDLKSKGYEVKSGLKYGAIFRVYDKGVKVGKGHSIWLVDVFQEKDKLSMKDYFAKSRIANTTKKKILLAVIDMERDISYIESTWKKN